MQIKFNGETEDISMMLVSAERYALGRRTYIVQWTCEIIKKNMHLLSEKDKLVMIRGKLESDFKIDISEIYFFKNKGVK